MAPVCCPIYLAYGANVDETHLHASFTRAIPDCTYKLFCRIVKGQGPCSWAKLITFNDISAGLLLCNINTIHETKTKLFLVVKRSHFNNYKLQSYEEGYKEFLALVLYKHFFGYLLLHLLGELS